MNNKFTEDMQKCPLCQTEYNDMTKVCPLKHCSNCGSLKLQTHKKRSFQSNRAKLNFIIILPPLGFFVLVYGYLFVQGELVSFLSIVAIYSVFFIAVLAKTTKPNINCTECKAKNFPSITKIYLNPIIKKETSIYEDDLTKISKKILETLSKEQKKHNKKDIIIRIGGAISLTVIAIFGTFFVNPDSNLFEEIIEMIKFFQ
ncbi:MAG: hypothetical protein OEL77_01125 [Nitrosopumilus sp.]|nr:hypothetical protein [Nitrosopumilus sp.]MDH3384599.1 hypothetical protein [Nitrosopumilus sp.]